MSFEPRSAYDQDDRKMFLTHFLEVSTLDTCMSLTSHTSTGGTQSEVSRLEVLPSNEHFLQDETLRWLQ
jgi:hypothetical protein